MEKRKIRFSATQGNYPIKEKSSLPSETVPDQSYTVREILQKFASGTLQDVYLAPEFSEDLPDLRGYDISEIHQMKKDNLSKIKALDKKKNQPPPIPPSEPTEPTEPINV